MSIDLQNPAVLKLKELLENRDNSESSTKDNKNLLKIKSNIKVYLDYLKDLYTLITKTHVAAVIFNNNIYYENGSSLSTDIEFETCRDNLQSYFNLHEQILIDNIEDLYNAESGKFALPKVWKALLVEQKDFKEVRSALEKEICDVILKYNVEMLAKNPKWTNFTRNLTTALMTVLVIKEFIPGIVCDLFSSGLREKSDYYIFNEGENKRERVYTSINVKNITIKSITVGPDINSYLNLPFYATHIWEQTKKDLSNYSITFGKDENEELITNTTFLNPSGLGIGQKTLIVAAGSGSGKGVLGLVVLANALHFNMPLIYADNKPDMARTLFNLTSPQPSLVLDGVSEPGFYMQKGKYLNRLINNISYLDYSIGTLPTEFKDFIGEDLAKRLVNSISYTKIVELITNFINNTSTSPTSYRPLFILDEIQKYSQGLNDLLFKGQTQQTMGGEIGTLIQNNLSQIATSIPRYYKELQNWFKSVWDSFKATYSATYRQANFSLMVIFQDGSEFKNAGVGFIYSAISKLVDEKASLIYGTKSFKNSSKFNCESMISELQKSGQFGNDNQEVIASKVLGMGKFLYKDNNGRPHQLRSCLIVNDGITKEGYLIGRDEMGNLYKTFASCPEGIRNIVKRELYGSVISDEEMWNTVIPEENRILDFDHYCQKVINFNAKKHHTIGEKVTIGYDSLSQYIRYNGNKQDFFEKLFDYNPQSMGIESKSVEFINEIIKILRENKDYNRLYKGKEPIIQIIKDESDNTLVNSYTISLPNTDDFLDWLSSSQITIGIKDIYIKQLSGESLRTDAIKHTQVFDRLLEYIDNHNINTQVVNDDEISDFIKKLKIELSKPKYRDIFHHITLHNNFYELDDFAFSCLFGAGLEEFQNQLNNHNATVENFDIHKNILNTILTAKDEQQNEGKEENNESDGDTFNITDENVNKVEEDLSNIPKNENKIAVTQYAIKVGKLRDFYQRKADGYLEISPKSEEYGLIQTKAEMLNLFKKPKVIKGLLDKGVKLKDLNALTEKGLFGNSQFMNLFWLGCDKKIIPNGERASKFITSMQLLQDEIIINNKRIDLGQYLSGISLNKLWDFSDPNFSKLNLNLLVVDTSYLDKAYKDLKLDPNNVYGSFIDRMFKKFKKLDNLYLGQALFNRQRIDKAEVDKLNAIQKAKDYETLLTIATLSLSSDNNNSKTSNKELSVFEQIGNLGQTLGKTAKPVINSVKDSSQYLSVDGAMTKLNKFGRNVMNGVTSVFTFPIKVFGTIFGGLGRLFW